MYRVSVPLFFQLLTMYHSSLVTVLGTNIVVSTLFPDTEELACHCSRLLPSLQVMGPAWQFFFLDHTGPQGINNSSFCCVDAHSSHSFAFFVFIFMSFAYTTDHSQLTLSGAFYGTHTIQGIVCTRLSPRSVAIRVSDSFVHSF